MAKITYIRDSEQEGKSQLYIDGTTLESSTFRTDMADNIHVIQWNGSSGEIEYNDGTSNATISDISSYDFETRFTTKEKAIADAYALAIANNTYAEKRESEYPTIEEQLDEIYHNGIDGWKSTIKAVKDKYPKP
tara:strand:+ start:1703 stop:2104 length:402 start_codon:yes stop_codon:yes gene_type:complete